MSKKLGLLGAVPIAIGVMIGGGIFAVFGVDAEMFGTTAWLAFTGGGLVAFFSVVLAVTAVVLGLEVLYFERDMVCSGIDRTQR